MHRTAVARGRLRAACAVVVEHLESRQLFSTVPTGYSESPVASGLSSPLSMEFAPDGRLFVSEQGGAIRIIKNGSLLPNAALTLNVNSVGERGVLSVAFDPNFASNNFIYVYYTATTPTIHNRISRFTMTGDTINAASETVIFDLDTQTDAYHMGGDMHFGIDGKLYITTGENFDESNAQLLTNLKGKMLRINADGSIPADNPFLAQTTGKNQAIYAYGLRNPFTFDIQPGTGKIYVNDVGGGNFEEINEILPGKNYGWPNAEGNNTNPLYTNPVFAYPHSGPNDLSGFAITGGGFYNPTNAEFPADMIGKYFFTDYVNGWIRVFNPATGTASPFATNVPAATDLEISADGSLYYLNRGSDSNTGGVYRIRYVAAPTIVTPPQSQAVQPGASVTFSVTATGVGPLSYQWQRNGVNIAGATSSSYTFNAAAADNGAKYRVLVTDSLGNGSLVGGTSWVAGPTGNGTAVQFNGVNGSVQSGLDLSQWLGGTSTLTAWIKTSQVGAFFYESPGITGVEQSQGDNDIMWGWIDDQGKIGIHPGNALGGISANPINNNQWRHVAFTRNATTGVIQVYVDGLLSGSANSAAGLKTTPFYGIGVIDDTGGTPEFFQGALDDVRIYNRALTAAELANAAALPTSGLVTHYAFNEGAGAIAFNGVPAGNTATSAEATLVVASGSAPSPTILTPTIGSLYTAGQTISFSGSGTDTEDGTLPPSAFTWRIDLHHDTHSHPAMPDLVGVTSGTFTIPTNVETSSNVWYRVWLTVTDSSGQSISTFRDIQPNKANITVTSNVPGLQLTLDGTPITGPTTFVGVAGVERTIGAPASQLIGNVTYTFTGWSDGGAATHSISTPAVNTTYTANYAAIATTFVSDLTPVGTPLNGWGPIEKDKSNGEQGAGDGGTLTLNGVTYQKGIGVHAGSDITYNLAGAFGAFLSDIGIDDESGNAGSVVFEVYLDGVLAYTSGPMTGATATKQINLDVSGKNTLRLVVTTGGDNNWDDHGDWANARLTAGAPNTNPVGTILTPLVGAKYSAGTTLNFSGDATDTEDGTLPASAFAWKIEQFHDDHSHLVHTATGAKSGSWAIPTTGETSANVFYRVTLTVTDSGGKTHVVTRDVTPNIVTVTLSSNIAGIPLTVDGLASSSSFVGVTGITRTLAAPASFVVAGTTYNFTGWSDGGAASHAISTPATSTTYTATYVVAPPNTPPVPAIVTPVVNAKYIAGQAINFSGDATDAEDGTLAASKFAWKVDFYKDGLFVSTVATVNAAKSGSYTPPTSGEMSANVFYRISLTVTDAAGAAVTVTRDVLPTTVTLTFASNPAGVPFTLDGAAVTGPVVSVVGKVRTIAAPANAVIGGTTYNFASWSDAGAATHTIATPAASTTYTATYTAAPVGGTPVYLSDLTPVGTPINGWGVYEKDKSNGEQGATDGKTITLQGVTYAKGLGVHANSDLTFNLGGQYATFLTDMGIDDEVGNAGNVTFVVYLDGVQAYTSGAMTGSTATKSLTLNVTGKQTLRLVVTPGTSLNDDHADWANARLLPATGALPTGWTSGNVGTVGATGSAGFVGGNYVISGAGAGITGTADALRYTYQQLSGNMMITARVTSLSVGAAAGVMLRTSLTANSAQASLLMNSVGGFSWSRRTSTGGSTTTTNSATSAQPYWVRIQRVGNTITTFRSTNGTTWTQVGTQSITLGTSVYVGLAVTSKVSATAATAVFDNVLITPL